MTINVILACDIANGIGNNGGLPWPYNSADMKWFKNNTKNSTVLMGRKTWKSLGSTPLKERINYVLTTDYEKHHREITDQGGVCLDGSSMPMEDVLERRELIHGNIWVIGGGKIYAEALPHADVLYLTRFKKEYICDTFVNNNLFLPFQKLVHSEDTPECSFTKWERL